MLSRGARGRDTGSVGSLATVVEVSADPATTLLGVDPAGVVVGGVVGAVTGGTATGMVVVTGAKTVSRALAVRSPCT